MTYVCPEVVFQTKYLPIQISRGGQEVVIELRNFF